jgi:hypothetical protein
MSNKSQITIAIISILVILSAGIYVLTKYRPVETLPNVATSSLSQTVLSQSVSFSSKSVVLSSSSQAQTVSSEIVKTEIATTVTQSKVDLGSNPNPIQDIPNVTKLSTDKSIYWQYVKDYLACPTKFYQTLNGAYENDSSKQFMYYCISQTDINNCNSMKNKFRDG